MMKAKLLFLPVLLTLAACGGAPERFAREAPLAPVASAPPRAFTIPGQPAQPGAAAAPRTAGALNMAGIGSYMDAQESDLRNRLRGTGVMITRPGDDLVLIIRNDLLLDGTQQLSGSGLELLARIAAVLTHYDRSSIQVQGYTDTAGPPDRNLALSDQRARTVLGALIENGMPRTRISAQGFGETRLRVPTGDNANEPRNRRIEIRITARPG